MKIWERTIWIIVLLMLVACLSWMGILKSSINSKIDTLQQQVDTNEQWLQKVEDNLSDNIHDISVAIDTLQQQVDTNERWLQKAELERLSSYEGHHRYGLKPSDFFYGAMFDLDKNWTNDGFINPEGEWLMAYSKKTWLYPALTFECIWPTLDATVKNAIVGFESGGRGLISRSFLTVISDSFRLSSGRGAYPTISSLKLTTFLPADYDTVRHRYGLKLNKSNVEAFIDDKFVGIVLFGLSEAIPEWTDTHPYAIGGTTSQINIAMRTPIAVLLEPPAPHPSITLGIRWEGDQLVCNDGDPLPPRQYALYTENSTTKWNGLSTSIAVTSHPIPVWGYERKTLLFQSNGAGTLAIEVYTAGDWRELYSTTLTANELEVYNLEGEVPIARCVYTPKGTDTITVAEWYLSGG